MSRRLFLAVFASYTVIATFPVALAEPKSLELFGIPLRGATRDQLRHSFKANGLRATREDNAYWVDTYDATGVLDGASILQAGYVVASKKFAYAQYVFPGFMDTQLVVKVIDMVTTKYGRPSSQIGSYGLGEVTAKWNISQGMQIEVWRGWPDTTTYLSFIDSSATGQMNAEINAEKRSQTNQRAKVQGNAF